MSVNQLSIAISRLQIQLQAMTPGTLEYFRVQAELQHMTQAMGGARGNVRGLNF